MKRVKADQLRDKLIKMTEAVISEYRYFDYNIPMLEKTYYQNTVVDKLILLREIHLLLGLPWGYDFNIADICDKEYNLHIRDKLPEPLKTILMVETGDAKLNDIFAILKQQGKLK